MSESNTTRDFQINKLLISLKNQEYKVKLAMLEMYNLGYKHGKEERVDKCPHL